MLKKIVPTIALVTSIALATIPTTPANAAPARNGVAAIKMKINAYYGQNYGPNVYSTGFSPGVAWSARDRSGAEVQGMNCQIQIYFPGTTKPTYKSALCQGGVGVTDNGLYSNPGHYRIIVVDKISGKRAWRWFTIE